MHRLKTLLTVLLVIFGTLGLAAAPRFGERPFIDIYQVPDSAMEQGHIRIKLSEANSALAQSFQYQDGALASFGLEELDALNLQYGVKKISPVFGEVNKNLKWGWRHVEWGLHLWFELEYDSEADIREIVMAYRNLAKDVQWAEPEYKKTLFSVNQGEVSAIADNLVRWTPNDPRYGEQWHYHNTGQTGGTVDADIDLPEAWDIEKGHSDVVVCIQDQGVQYDHPDLAANMWINPGEIAGNGIDDDNNGYVDDVYGYNFYQSTSNIVGGDHGCHVAGTVAAVTNNGVGVSGIAGGSGTGNGVRLMSTQVFAPTSGGGGFEQAPIYAADNGACISQNSWGYTNVGSYEQSVLDAIDYFNANGGGSVMSNGITIYAAGNSQSSGQWYPGCYSGVFAVAATTHNDTKAWYSNYDTWVDVSAPGGETNSVTSQGVLSCWSGSGYGFYQGTSMACPHASGVAALVVSYAHRNGRTLSSADVENILESTADDHYAVNQSYIGQLGSGRINAFQALLATDPTLPSVSITAPASGSVHDLNSSITITATASDTDGYITSVAFYIDDVLKSTDTSSPYSWVWNTTGYAGGPHSIKVIATDNSGNTATRSITVTLLAPPDEGFETGNFTLYPWINNSPVPWTVQNSEVFTGTYAAKSGAIGNSSSTTLSLPVVVSSAGNLSFWYKVSSESNYDFLRFYVDGVKQGEWSGSAGWAEASYPLTSGSHTLAWTYSKDSSWANGSDCAWLDHIIFPPMGTYYAPPQNLTATSGNAVVNLNWQAPATGTPNSYKVYRDGSYLASTGGLNYSDTNVVNETSYEYYVTAIYGAEESDPSNTVTGFPTTNPLSTIIIGTGSETQPYPINRYWNYSSHEAIYLASQIGTACNIRYLGF
ncbi:MAG TPA: S8 family serine peptidase, partial [Candidatus Syntrophosphaera sp.]|nr:S8 family serine peptidase [Candidatus Syntrophosphaera sp.]